MFKGLNNKVGLLIVEAFFFTSLIIYGLTLG